MITLESISEDEFPLTCYVFNYEEECINKIIINIDGTHNWPTCIEQVFTLLRRGNDNFIFAHLDGMVVGDVFCFTEAEAYKAALEGYIEVMNDNNTAIKQIETELDGARQANVEISNLCDKLKKLINKTENYEDIYDYM